MGKINSKLKDKAFLYMEREIEVILDPYMNEKYKRKDMKKLLNNLKIIILFELIFVHKKYTSLNEILSRNIDIKKLYLLE